MIEALSRVGLRQLLLVSIVSLLGCASPREHLYTLDASSSELPPSVLSPVAMERPTVVVGPISIPQLVDRPELVVRESVYTVATIEQERWAAPLKEALPRLMAVEMQRRMPDKLFLTFSSAVIAAPVARVLIDVTRFDVARDGANVDAHWVYKPTPPVASKSESTSISGDVSVHEDLANQAVKQEGLVDARYESYVDALRRACNSLAGQIANRLGPQ